MSTSSYIKSFLEKGKIVINDKNSNFAENKKLFKSVLNQLHIEHKEFVQECTREKILKIDHQNLIIEVVL